jgi:hypothetical protein
MNIKIDLIFILIIVIITLHTYYNIKEDFANTPEVFDESSNRNLASIANKLMTPTGLDIQDDIQFNGIIKVNGTHILPIGSIIAYTNNNLPGNGWLWCDGTSIADAKYTELRNIFWLLNHCF